MVDIIRIILYEVRIARNYTLEKLEAKSGVGKSEINYIEHGTKSPTLNTLDKLAQALGVTAKDLFEC